MENNNKFIDGCSKIMMGCATAMVMIATGVIGYLGFNTIRSDREAVKIEKALTDKIINNQ